MNTKSQHNLKKLVRFETDVAKSTVFIYSFVLKLLHTYLEWKSS